MGFKELLNNAKLVCFVTSTKGGKPNAIFAESWFFENKILLVDCHMEKTVKNLKENPQVAVSAQNGKEYYQIKGTAEYLTEGKYFKKAKEIVAGTEYTAKGAVLVEIKEVWDLDKRKKIL